MTEAEKRKQTLAETRRLLPVFPFREKFIEAVQQYQVYMVSILLPLGAFAAEN